LGLTGDGADSLGGGRGSRINPLTSFADLSVCLHSNDKRVMGHTGEGRAEGTDREPGNMGITGED
jgi:hypothetical protein